MPPKNRFTKEEIIAAATEIVAEGGSAALTARSLGERLASSTKPIFGYFESMEELLSAVLLEANARYQRTLAEEFASGKFPPYKASGMGYIRFASEEKELFRLLFMRDRSGERLSEDREAIAPLLTVLETVYGLSADDAYLFHLEMWIFVHGIATMRATSYLPWDEAFISHALSDMFWGLLSRYKKEYMHEGH